MGKQRKTRPAIVNKNLKALVELQWRLSEGMKVSASSFMNEHRLSGSFFMILKKKGIIKKSGGVGRGKNVTYTWETKQPDRAMAKAVTECMTKYNRDLTQVRAKKKETKEAHTWVEEIVAETTPRPDTRKIEDFPVELEVVKPLPKEKKEIITTETTYFGIFKVRKVWVRTVTK